MLVLLVAIWAGCGGDSITPTLVDAGVSLDGPPPDAREMPGLFGEACTADSFPAATVCHDDAGWCIDSVCRPMCSESDPRCRIGVMHFAKSGACYCAPS